MSILKTRSAVVAAAEAANQEPWAEIDFLIMDPKAPVLSISVADLLSNDRDPDAGDTIKIVSVQEGIYGTVELVPGVDGGHVLFRPSADFAESYSHSEYNYGVFSYEITDSHGATAGTNVVIEPSYVYRRLNQVTVSEDSSVEAATFSGDIITSPQHGHLEYKSLGYETYEVTYVPDHNYFGPDSFEYYEYRAPWDNGNGSIGGFRVEARGRVEINVTPVDEAAYLRGTAGADTLDQSSATSPVQIAALDGSDTLRGGTGSDALNGGAGNDIITGGAGNDSITGGIGIDRLGGGAGNDTFHIARGDLSLTGATDLIVDFQGAGQAGGDVIRFSGFAADSTLELVGTSGNARVYEVHDTAGVSEGQLLVSAGGALGQELTTSDYAFA